MIQSITLRKGYALAAPVWRTAPWSNTTKDKEQVLYDLGFFLACLLEQTDLLLKLGPLEYDTSGFDLFLRVIKSSLELINTLSKFKVDHFTESILLSDAYHAQLPESYNRAYGNTKMKFELESLVMTWWSFEVILAFNSKSIADLSRHVLCLPASTSDALGSLVEQLETFYGDKGRDHLGRKVLAIIETILQSAMGHFWFSRTIFPLTAATLQFHQSKPDMDLCERIKEKITKRKGFRFAQRLTSQSGLQIAFDDSPMIELL